MIFLAVGWLLLLFLGVPVAFSLGVAVVLYMLATSGTHLLVNVPGRMVGSLDSFPLLAVPLFILAGNLMDRTGMARRLVTFADELFGFLPGGLGQVAVVAEVVQSGMTGSGMADAAAIGSVFIPQMRAKGFSGAFAGAIIGASASLGPLIPPSIPMIIYGVLAGASIGALFVAGIPAGLITAFFLMLLIAYLSRTRKIPRREPPRFGPAIRATVSALPVLVMPVIILGGIFAGVFTPTEAAVVACIYAMMIGFFSRSLRFVDMLSIFLETAHVTAAILFIVATAGLFAWFLAFNQVPQQLMDLLLSWSSDPKVIMFLLLVFIIVMGLFLEMMAVLVMSMPIINPILQTFNIDPVLFGVVFSLGAMIGTITPPFGLILFLLRSMTGESIGRLVRELLPFYAILIAVLFLMAYVPSVILYLPNLVFGP
jgi:tripartite ATP-independent transporter DctM subunit